MATKKRWFLPLLAVVQFALLALLIPANCRQETNKKNPFDSKCRDTEKTKTTAVANTRDAGQRTCHGDYDCPLPSTYCQNGACELDPAYEEYQEEGVADGGSDAGKEDAAQSCETSANCPCGYRCLDNECWWWPGRSCCADTDCKKGDFCSKNKDGQEGYCTTWECNTDDQCGKCGGKCNDHLCTRINCCADSDCGAGEFCNTYFAEEYAFCAKSECNSNADCDCGRVCADHICRMGCSADKPCCGTDICDDGWCEGHYRVENGHCLNDSHCPPDHVCYDRYICLPATCEKNADCGCMSVCRKNKCETGCDNDSDCCENENGEKTTCDRGVCIGPNEERYPK